MIKRIVCVLVLFTLLFSMESKVLADPFNQQLQVQKNQLETNKDALEAIKEKRDQLENKIEIYDSQIEDILNKIEANKADIKATQEKIKTAEEQLKDAQEELNKKREIFNVRIKTVYMYGQIKYIDFLFNADSLSDFLSRFYYTMKVAQFDNTIIQQLEDQKNKIELKKQELNADNERLNQLLSDNEDQLDVLTENRTNEEKLLEEVKSQELLLSGYLAELQIQINNLVDKIKSQRTAALDKELYNDNVVLSGNYKVNDILSYAFKFMGTPYLWGGTKPETGFDCSGFTQYVFRHFGINIGRTTKNQINDGPHIERKDLMPGDLVLFGNNGVPHHVGIYLGNNYYLHSPRTGDVIKVSEMTRKDLITGVRVIK